MEFFSPAPKFLIMDEEFCKEALIQPSTDLPQSHPETHNSQNADVQESHSSLHHDEHEFVSDNSKIQPTIEEPKPNNDAKIDHKEHSLETALDGSVSNGMMISQKTLDSVQAHETEESGTKTKITRRRFSELSEKYNFRKECPSQSQNYSLREKVKGNKRLDFYTKITKQDLVNQGHSKSKSKAHQAPKLSQNDSELTPEEKE